MTQFRELRACPECGAAKGFACRKWTCPQLVMAPSEAAAPATEADVSRARATSPSEDAMPLQLQAAYAVYTANELMAGQGAAPLEVFLADTAMVEACVVLAAVCFALCDNSPHLQSLRTTALKVLDVAPELGASLIEALAAFDAQLNGKA